MTTTTRVIHSFLHSILSHLRFVTSFHLRISTYWALKKSIGNIAYFDDLLTYNFSPRSLEACKRQGIEPSELITKTFNDIKELYSEHGLDKEGIEMLVDHYEHKRRQKIVTLIKVNSLSKIEC